LITRILAEDIAFEIGHSFASYDIALCIDHQRPTHQILSDQKIFLWTYGRTDVRLDGQTDTETILSRPKEFWVCI